MLQANIIEKCKANWEIRWQTGGGTAYIAMLSVSWIQTAFTVNDEDCASNPRVYGSRVSLLIPKWLTMKADVVQKYTQEKVNIEFEGIRNVKQSPRKRTPQLWLCSSILRAFLALELGHQITNRPWLLCIRIEAFSLSLETRPSLIKRSVTTWSTHYSSGEHFPT